MIAVDTIAFSTSTIVAPDAGGFDSTFETEISGKVLIVDNMLTGDGTSSASCDVVFDSTGTCDGGNGFGSTTELRDTGFDNTILAYLSGFMVRRGTVNVGLFNVVVGCTICVGNTAEVIGICLFINTNLPTGLETMFFCNGCGCTISDTETSEVCNLELWVNIWLSSAKIMGRSIISCEVKLVGGGKLVENDEITVDFTPETGGL